MIRHQSSLPDLLRTRGKQWKQCFFKSGIVGLRRQAEFHPQPPADTTIRPGDILVAIGTPATLERLEDLLAPASTPGRGPEGLLA